jgi:chemotaxis protein MotB
MIINTLRRSLIISTLASAALLSACVSQEKYNQLNDAYIKLQKAYQGDEVEIKELQGELKVTIKDKILFPEGGFRLDPKAQDMLAKMVPTLSGFKNTKVVVRGFTDNVPIGPGLQREGISTNLDLSSKRADNVVDFLLKKGVNPSLISAQGMGETNPVATNATPEGRAQNRRIEVTLIGPGN